MDPMEFEIRYQEQMREILNRLQSAMAASSHLESSVADIGDSLQRLSREVEQFLASQRLSQPDHQS